MSYVIGIYEIGQSYGGPEEGGWWYDTGELRRTLIVVPKEDEAYRIARRMNGWLHRLAKLGGVREVSSVLYTGGRYSAQVHEHFAPLHYPETRPHYE